MKLGFIGCGNMSTAMISGIIKNNIFKGEEIIASDLFAAGREKLKETFNISATCSNREVVEKSEVIVLAVKPQFYADVINDIKDIIRENQIVITIAPGKTIQWIEEEFDKKIKIVRTMPNTPAMVLEGMTAVCCNNQVSKDELDYTCNILSGFSKVEVVSENLMDVVTSVSGSSPAYVFMLIEAMADAAVADGMPRSQAYKFAAQAVYGSAKMVLELEKHPGELKDMVCSPGGTTIEAVRVLENKGMRSAIMEAMKACTYKSKNM
ncbi:pyrroline-5-carboxylate reductase [Terrisporobacter mayombei]|uniref:Pyrroline-5-carboxylate reductase n=1 Tax=Terrisporobacter mayombei TaxID=1541 RepID=A0ABY9Q0A7_9FIRM|nr:pyrroline-5-carboxylate reductase [Terrisporobacter mayombei]MCC3866686.1 pyrroline-5-carboxylate reductase [Terrisporobacter mayombei]WMT80923.1 Pyrroline-5-carboxylate reductase [Terrisporobacter mayombei]